MFAQIIAIVIFLGMFLLIISDKLGALLQILRTCNDACDARVHGVFAFALPIKRKKGIQIYEKTNYCCDWPRTR